MSLAGHERVGAKESEAFLDSPLFSDIDRRFAEFATRQSGEASRNLALAAALVSRARGEGHICVDLRKISGAEFPTQPHSHGPTVALPKFESWTAELRRSRIVGEPAEFKPLILDKTGRLYLHRYWSYENSLALAIRKRAETPPTTHSLVPSDAWLGDALARYFPADSSGEINWQKVAAFTALTRQFCVISGGPGTGKTRTVAIVLAMLLELPRERPLRIALAAPTGKAAVRLQESIDATARILPCSDAVRSALPREAVTLHRLLGLMPDSERSKYDARNPLSVDFLVVDEASMVDLALMSKLFEALPAPATVVLVGDRDQLASVEAGAVLGDICRGHAANTFSAQVCARFRAATGAELPAAAAERASSLGDCIVQLQKNYRFGARSEIHNLSQSINEGNADAVTCLLDQKPVAALDLNALVVGTVPTDAGLKAKLRDTVLRQFGDVLNVGNVKDALHALDRFRILCALRQGPFGAERVNRLAEELLAEERRIPRNDPWYVGRPVIVRKNDYGLRLFNGDVGVIWHDADSGLRKAFFLDAKGELRGFAPVRLPDHETMFAMTVHRSQGSEFDAVLLLLPGHDSPVLTRELIYTGATRASRRLEVWLDSEVFKIAVARRVERSSGLHDGLWNRDASTIHTS